MTTPASAVTAPTPAAPPPAPPSPVAATPSPPPAEAAGAAPAADSAAATTQTEQGSTILTEGGEAKAQESAPAELELKLPEGVTPDAVQLEAFKAIAKEGGLKGEVAQKVVDHLARAHTTVLEQSKARWAQQVKQWSEATKADKELGGAAFEKTVASAKKALTKFATPELRQYLEDSGLGSHPEMVRLMARMGAQVSEDSIAGSSASPAATDSEEAALRRQYPTMFPKE